MKAFWNNELIAQSDDTIVVENNHYFPKNCLNTDFIRASQTHTSCPWKGQASYFDLIVNGKENKDAAWYYPNPKDAALNIKDHVAFWKGVQILP